MQKISKLNFVLAALALLVSACAPAAPATPQPLETASLLDVQSQVNTLVAQTVEAQNQIGTLVAQTVEAQATATPTATLFSIPTFTPFVIETATPRPSGGGSSGGSGSGGSSGGSSSGGGPGSPKYDCALVNQKPRDGDYIYKPGDSFDIKWTLKNIGTKTIPADAFFHYISGVNMSPTAGYMIGVDVLPGETITLVADVDVPAVTGVEKEQLTMQWALVVNGDKICKPYISIFVQNR